MNILRRITRALAGPDPSSDQTAFSGGTAGTEIGLQQVEAAERREFPPEELASLDEDSDEEERE